jgi:hypothetical protein
MVRIVNALNGNVAAAPSKFMQALSEADEFCRERDSRAELEIRNLELHAEIRSLHADLARAIDQRDAARQERDTYRARADRRGW